MNIKKYNFNNFNLQCKEDIIAVLSLRGKEQEALFRFARQVRLENCANKVEVRSVIEYSNICFQECNYCGMYCDSTISRYILTDQELLRGVDILYKKGRRVINIQAGDNFSDNYFNKIASLLKIIKEKYPDLDLICSLGNFEDEKYRELKQMGVDRYLLKFESSNPNIYKEIKPSDTLENRLRCVQVLKDLKFLVSSGNITGLPGQSLSDLADDLLLIEKLALPMTSTSPFIPNNLSAFSGYPMADLDLTLNVMALMRIMNPQALIPTTSALELLAEGGQYLGLMAGANTITLHDGTPREKEKNYVIYKKERNKPQETLFDIVKKAGLICSAEPLL